MTAPRAFPRHTRQGTKLLPTSGRQRPSHRTRWLVALLLLLQLPLPAAEEMHPLWEIKSPSNTIHLLGSIHFLKPESYPLAPIIENTFEQASSVAFETDIEALSHPPTAMKMMQAGMCPPGKKLSDLVDATTYRRLEGVAGDYGIPMEGMSRMRPWLAAITLATIDIQKLGYNPEHGVDHRFHQRAKAQGKHILALESIDSQLSVFTSLAGTNEAAMLNQTLDDIKRIPVILNDIVDAWRTGNASRLDSLMNDAMKQSPGLYQKVLVDRNRNWIPRIEKLIQDGKPAIVIVGAGHLVGSEGVPELLRRKGYQVEQK